MKKIHLKHQVLGAYTLERSCGISQTHGKFYPTANLNGYLPVLELIKFNDDQSVKFTDGRQVSNDVITYNNRVQNNKSFSEDVIRNTKIETHLNDLIRGPVTVLLNFTKERLTVVGVDGFHEHFEPIYNSKFEQHKGSVLILTIRLFNHPKVMEKLTGSGNYFKLHRDELRNATQERTKHIRDIYDFLIHHPGIYEEDKFINPTSTVKVISIAEISEGELLHGEFIDADTGVLFSLKPYSQVNGNPLSDADLFTSDCLKDLVRPGELLIYINDPDDELEPQYINVAGSVVKVNKIKSRDRPTGLFMSLLNENLDIETTSIAISDIQKSDTVYSSREAATNGSNLKDRYSIELSELKSRFEREKLIRDAEHSRELSELEIDKKRRISELEQNQSITSVEIVRERQELDKQADLLSRNQAAFKLEMEKKKQELEIERETIKTNHTVDITNAKRHFEEYMNEATRHAAASKVSYEENKYRKDATVETIKALGSIVAAGAGVIYLYSKFSK